MRYSPRQRDAVRKIERKYISEKTRRPMLDEAIILLEKVQKKDFNALAKAGIVTLEYDHMT
jgi:hypothetical protein